MIKERSRPEDKDEESSCLNLNVANADATWEEGQPADKEIGQQCQIVKYVPLFHPRVDWIELTKLELRQKNIPYFSHL